MLAAATVTYQTERLSPELWSELEPLLADHWHEVAHYSDIPLQPNRELYQRIEQTGGMRIYTAREASALVGYLAVFVAPSLHYASIKMANQDVLYVDQKHRGSRTGVGLIRFAHDALRGEGVTVIFQHVKHKASINIGPMLGRLLGYEQVDDIWAKRLDRE